MGRPSSFTHEAFDEIIERVSSGEPLAQVCRSEHLPALSTFYGWLERGEDVSRRFARAREAGYDQIAADILQIADDGGNNPNHAKLRVEARLKLLSKWDPKRYGDAVQVKHAGNEGQSLRDVSESEAATKVASILEAVRRRALPELPEPSQSEED